MASSTASSRIGNLPISTVILEIYTALKNLDTRYNILEEFLRNKINDLDTRLTVLETKLNNINEIIVSLSISIKPPTLNTKLETQLLSQLNQLDNNNTLNKIILKSNEMSINNLCENNYTIDDVNNNIPPINTSSSTSHLNILHNFNNKTQENTNTTTHTNIIEKLIF